MHRLCLLRHTRHCFSDIRIHSTQGLCTICWANRSLLETQEKNSLIECLDLSLLQPHLQKPRKVEKYLKRDEILKKVTALRNSNGGSLFIHMRGMLRGERNMDSLSEYLDTSLNDLIEDGSAFVDEYIKQWLDGDDAGQYVVLTVSSSRSVSTADFKTKVALDNSVIKPTSLNIDRLLFDTNHRRFLPAQLRGLKEVEECRNIQFKHFQRNGLADRSLVDFIWEKLRLPEYITSFSKQDNGGSYYLGISEISHCGQRGILKDGIPESEMQRENFRVVMKKTIHENMTYYSPPNRELRKLPENSVDIGFYSVENDHIVMEIAVAPIDGCVFSDKNGPETYVIGEDQSLDRLSFENWIELFKTRTEEIKK